MGSGEFDLISRYLAPLSGVGAYGLTDDAAVLTPPEGKDLVFTKDALIAEVHFFAADPPDLIARKAMRVNLSDLAAMGAEPLGYLLALAFPKDMKNIDGWMAKFSAGLKLDQEEFGWFLYGGDTVVTSGPLMISLTAIGIVDKGQVLRRRGAKPGDNIYVSGTLGDAAFGLKCLKGEFTSIKTSVSKPLIDRYHMPRPRLGLGRKLFGIATATMDISDGLAGDLRHICALSGFGAEIEAELIPLSDDVGKLLESFPAYKNLIWNGGDDYELLFTAPKDMDDKIEKIARNLDLALTKIGHITLEKNVTIQGRDGINLLQNNDQGFRHF
ncbi:Thiamine-monophosphate kinase [hydrothermal vent metagenome]|uniref:Thiamine-monophosphate kinase n=1 Tax=hydrothermal vent metagenome TaxID=652676 RepID=A0A3B1BBW6_9ZZZZ